MEVKGFYYAKCNNFLFINLKDVDYNSIVPRNKKLSTLEHKK